MPSRAELVACARTFLGVRFAHQGRHAGEGLDCLGLLIATAEKAGCRLEGLRPSALDQRDYGARPDTHFLQWKLQVHLRRMELSLLRPGDVLLLNIEGRPQHLALVSDYPVVGEYGMIHAYAMARRVVEHRLDEGWRRAIHACYRLPELEVETEL